MSSDDYERMLREQFTYSINGSFGAGPSFYMPAPRSPIDEILSRISREYGPSVVDALRERFSRTGDTAALQAQLRTYAEAFAKLQKQAAPYAVVTSVRKDNAVINFAGKSLEVEIPTGKRLAPGMTVKVAADTMQIIDTVEDAQASGEVLTVTRIASPTICEVDRAGSSRALSYSGALEDGDRVIVDASGSVVVSNLGKAKNDCIVTEATGVRWDDIGGLAEAKRHLREAIEAPTRHADTLKKYGKRPIRGVLLYGAPGCGKTMLGKAAATALAELHGSAEAGAFFYVKGPELLNMYVGNTEERVRALFDAARRHRKKTGHAAIIFIDEADAILGKRGGSSLSLTSTVVPAFLAEMDGLEDSGALVLLATNRPNTLDPAVVRDGRIDRRIKVERPRMEDAREILLKHWRGKPLAMSEDEAADAAAIALFDKSLVLYHVRKHSSVGKGVAMTFGHTASGAMLAGVVDRATSLAMQRELAGGASDVTEADIRAAALESFHQALDVNHADEIAEFVNGWEAEVCGVEKARYGRAAVGAEAN